MTRNGEHFVVELADLLTVAIAHTDELQEPPFCDCSDEKAKSRAFRREMHEYRDAILLAINEAFTMLRVRAIDYDGQRQEKAVH